MNLPLFSWNYTSDFHLFITFWSKLYNYPRQELYLDRINKLSFSREDLQCLFDWKNGMTPSAKKQASLDSKILPHLKLINQLKQPGQFDLESFLIHFKAVSAVWKIFLLHIIKPDTYPIYDQHIHRAFNYIHGLDFSKITPTISKKRKESFYFDYYFPFVQELEVNNLKQMDEALFAFGQFLKKPSNVALIEASMIDLNRTFPTA